MTTDAEKPQKAEKTEKAGEQAPAVATIETELFDHPDHFSYFQTVNLLRRLDRMATDGAESEDDFLRKRLRVDGYLSLAFPPNDVVALEVKPPYDASRADLSKYPTFAEGERLHITATFMGLYGSASPLPTFYTEELLDDYREDYSAAKSFMDLIGQLFFVRYYQSLVKYRLLDRVVAEDSPDAHMRLDCLFGVGHPELMGGRDLTDADLSCTGLFSLRQRSASGLASYLATRFHLDRDQIEIEQCVPVTVAIPVDQRACLGASCVTLGSDALLGIQAEDRMGSFRVDIRDLDAEKYHSFLPGTRGWDELKWAIRFYVSAPLRFEVGLHIRHDHTEPARLDGGRWRELGADAFLGFGPGNETGAKIGSPRRVPPAPKTRLGEDEDDEEILSVGDVMGCRFQ